VCNDLAANVKDQQPLEEYVFTVLEITSLYKTVTNKA
jgi:hypothetical protein